uniref:(northern house mosquito) hypothetical protein n=1 Tax=Culex pipiens TaxID=7175 RepID=A0A8D8A899_CULPI
MRFTSRRKLSRSVFQRTLSDATSVALNALRISSQPRCATWTRCRRCFRCQRAGRARTQSISFSVSSLMWCCLAEAVPWAGEDGPAMMAGVTDKEPPPATAIDAWPARPGTTAAATAVAAIGGAIRVSLNLTLSICTLHYCFPWIRPACNRATATLA